MPNRVVRDKKIGYHEFTLAPGKVAFQGETACGNTATGYVQPAENGITTLLPIGTFHGISEEAGVTGDGTKKVTVKLPEEVGAVWRDNDLAGNDVVATDRFNSCFLKDSVTVSMDGTNRSVAGRVLDVDSFKGVLVQFGIANTGPTGASGAALAGGGVADRAALKALTAAERYDGKLVLVRSDGALFRFVAASSLAADGADELVIVPNAGTGRWFRADKDFTLRMPFSFATADGATLLTTPTGFALRLTGLPFWQIVADMTGGTSSTIGVASSLTGYTTAGDLLGGAAGDAAAALTAGFRPGTLGPKLDTPAEVQAFLLDGGKTITFERITSAFTAGSGFVCMPVSVVAPAS